MPTCRFLHVNVACIRVCKSEYICMYELSYSRATSISRPRNGFFILAETNVLGIPGGEIPRRVMDQEKELAITMYVSVHTMYG